MILNLRMSADLHTVQHTLTTGRTVEPVSEWDSTPHFAKNDSLAYDSFELSTMGRTNDGMRTYVEGLDNA